MFLEIAKSTFRLSLALAFRPAVLRWKDFHWDRFEKVREPLTLVQPMEVKNAVRVRAEEGTDEIKQWHEDPRLKSKRCFTPLKLRPGFF